MPETKQPVPYETLVRLQVAADRALAASRELEECVERIDGWIAGRLGLVANGELKGDDYSDAVAEEFLRCVEARQAQEGSQ